MERSITKGQEEKENLMIEQDIMQLEVSKLQQVLSDKSTSLTSLENRKAVMTESTKEKKAEIARQQDCLRYDLKNLRDDLHRVKLELTDKQQKSEKLKLKYETTAS